MTGRNGGSLEDLVAEAASEIADSLLADQIGTSPKKTRKPRGMGRQSLDLIAEMRIEAEKAQPITGRGIGYKLFSRGLIVSMSRPDMARVYRLLKEAREQGTIPWEWIVDETRSIERVATWSTLEDYARTMRASYRRDPWDEQPVRVEVWSEKGTVRGVLKPVLDQYAVGFNAVHGFNSATNTMDAAKGGDGRDLIILYVGDLDPSGLFMSEEDLPKRLAEYGGAHIKVKRIALTREHVRGLPPFPAVEKRKDPRYPWFIKNHGNDCWELDALDPNTLRDCVEGEIKKLIEPKAWQMWEIINGEEREHLKDVMGAWARWLSKRAPGVGRLWGAAS
jgi:hypothetical protein